VTESLGKSMGELLEELPPLSNGPMTKLRASRWEICLVIKLFGERVVMQVTGRVAGKVAARYVERPSNAQSF
jgi:hypothetical protein